MKSAKSPRLLDTAEHDPRWLQVVARDKSADGHFVYAVTTTGVYCHPSCPSPMAKPQHVEFYPTAEAAGMAGYRPCRRCHAGDSAAVADEVVIMSIYREIQAADPIPTSATLAARLGMSPSQFSRAFKRYTGLTVRDYVQSVQAERARAALQTSASVTEAMYEAGYQSSGRFYEAMPQQLGMTPSQFRQGGPDVHIHFALAQCSLGAILVAESSKGVCAILLGDSPDVLLEQLQDTFPRAELLGSDEDFEQRVALVVGFVEAPQMGLRLPLDIRGTVFQQRVWQALRAIPVGSTVSYADIARQIGQPNAVRAVAGACAANMLAVAVPCHRVVRQNGELSGYRWGVERKRELLLREAKGEGILSLPVVSKSEA